MQCLIWCRHKFALWEGGIFYIPKRYSQANKKYLKCYDPKQK